MKLKDSYGKECDIEIRDLKRITPEDKKTIEGFVKASGCKFSEFSGFSAQRDVILITAVCKDNPYPEKMASEIELRLYKNQVDGRFCGFAYSGKFIENGEQYYDLMFNDEFLRLSVAEEEHYPQMMKLFSKAEEFFCMRGLDSRSAFENERRIVKELSRPAPEFLRAFNNELSKYAKTSPVEDGIAFEYNGEEEFVTVKQIKGVPYLEMNGFVYTDIPAFIDSYFCGLEKDENDREK